MIVVDFVVIAFPERFEKLRKAVTKTSRNRNKAMVMPIGSMSHRSSTESLPPMHNESPTDQDVDSEDSISAASQMSHPALGKQ